MPYTRRLAVQDISIEPLTESDNTSVASGASSTITVTAPTGYIYEVVSMLYHAGLPAGGSSGDHTLTAFPLGATTHSLFRAVSSYNKRITWKYNVWHTDTTSPEPSNSGDMQQAIKGLMADETNGFKLVYHNNTDVAQTGNRELFFIVRKIKVV